MKKVIVKKATENKTAVTLDLISAFLEKIALTVSISKDFATVSYQYDNGETENGNTRTADQILSGFSELEKKDFSAKLRKKIESAIETAFLKAYKGNFVALTVNRTVSYKIPTDLLGDSKLKIFPILAEKSMTGEEKAEYYNALKMALNAYAFYCNTTATVSGKKALVEFKYHISRCFKAILHDTHNVSCNDKDVKTLIGNTLRTGKGKNTTATEKQFAESVETVLQLKLSEKEYFVALASCDKNENGTVPQAIKYEAPENQPKKKNKTQKKTN